MEFLHLKNDSLIESDELIYLIHYGSSLDSQDYHDIDLVAVSLASQQAGSCVIGKYDILVLDYESWKSYGQYLDPAYFTEYMLKGNLVKGDKESFNSAKEWLQAQSGTEEIARYQLRRSNEEHLRAIAFLNEHDPLSALINLSFSVSYWLFAKWYAEGNTPATLSRLLQEPYDGKSILGKIFNENERALSDLESPSRNNVSKLLAEWEMMLIGRQD